MEKGKQTAMQGKTMILGVDMGGTNTRMGLVGADLKLIHGCRVWPSSRFALADDPVDELWQMMLDYYSSAGISPDETGMISIGVPASVRGDLRTIFCAPNLHRSDGSLVFENFDLASALEERSGLPVLVNKDVNNLLCYDMMANDLQGIVVSCYIGTGVGGAVSIGGKILLGRDGVAMDLGHIPLYHRDRPCGCGKLGCLETEVSGTYLLRFCKEHYPGEDPAMLFTCHGNEEPVRAYIKDCAHAPAILLSIFNPSAIVLGGGVTEAENFPRRLLEKEILAAAVNAVSDAAPAFIYADRLPERGVIGAAIFAANPAVIRY